MSRIERVLSTGAVPLDGTQRERVKVIIRSVQERSGYHPPPIEQFPKAKQVVVEEIWLYKTLGVLSDDRRKLSGPLGLFRHRHFLDLRQLAYDEFLVLRRLKELAPDSY